MDYTRGERVVLWAVARTPQWLLEAPERVLLNMALLVIGVTTFLPPPPGNVLDDFPTLGRMLLGAVFMTGAAVSIFGTVKLSRAADRFGAMALGSVSLFFAVLLFGTVGLRAMLIGTIFVFVALAKAFRWLRTTAYSIRIRHHLEAVKEVQEREADDER